MKQTIFVLAVTLIAACSFSWSAGSDFEMSIVPSQETIQGTALNTDVTFDVLLTTSIDQVSGWSYGVTVDQAAANGLQVNITGAQNYTYMKDMFSNDCLIFAEGNTTVPAGRGPCYFIADTCDDSLDLTQWFFVQDFSGDCIALAGNPAAKVNMPDFYDNAMTGIRALCGTTGVADGIGFVQGVVTSSNLALTIDVDDSPFLMARITVHVEGDVTEGQEVKLVFTDELNQPATPTVVVYDNKSFAPEVQNSGVIAVEPPPPAPADISVELGDAAAGMNETDTLIAVVNLDAAGDEANDTDEDVLGWSYTAEIADTAKAIIVGAELGDDTAGFAPEVSDINFTDATVEHNVLIKSDQSSGIPPANGLEDLVIEVQILTDVEGDCTTISATAGEKIDADQVKEFAGSDDGEICFQAKIDVGIPGEVNGDCRIDIADPIYLLNAEYRGGPAIPCEAAADANNDGDVNQADAVYLLQYLFLEGPAPANPELIEPNGPLSCDNPPSC